jgi:hypothetical protein
MGTRLQKIQLGRDSQVRPRPNRLCLKSFHRLCSLAIRSLPRHLFPSLEDAGLVVTLLFIYLHNNVEMGGSSSF